MKNYLLPHQDNEILKEINHYYPKTMAVLHYDCGFDYSKPYRVIRHSGKFTIKSLERDYSITSDDNVAILSKDKFFQILHLYVYPDGKNVYDYRDVDGRTNMMKTCVYDFATKKSFEEVRKAGGVFYIFIQNKNDSVERSGRILNKGMDKSFRNYTDNDYRYYREETDKSGYILNYYRDNLKARLIKLRTEQDKKKFNKTELNEEFKKHTKIAKKQKEVIVNLLSDADILELSKLRYLLDIQRDLSKYSSEIKELSMCTYESYFRLTLERCEHFRVLVAKEINYYIENYIKA